MYILVKRTATDNELGIEHDQSNVLFGTDGHISTEFRRIMKINNESVGTDLSRPFLTVVIGPLGRDESVPTDSQIRFL